MPDLCSHMRLICVTFYGMSMTTLTATSARTNLSRLLRRALKGEDIGIVMDGKIVALRPVPVESTDYAMREYGLSPTEMAAVESNLHEQIQKERKTGRLHEFTGDIEALVAGKGRR